MTAPIIAVACHKGGTGKTTTAYWLGYHLAALGRLHLLIDLDPLATLTRLTGLGVGGRTIADVLLGECRLSDARRGSTRALNVITADSKLAWAAAYMQAQSPNHKFLFNALRDLPANVIAVIDCPPSAGNLIVNALVAATHVVIPVEPETEAIDGMLHMLDMVQDCQDLGNGARIIGIVITRANANVLRHQQGIERIQQEMDDRDLSVLGVIPMRQGIDAQARLQEAYAPIARDVLFAVGGGS